MENFFIDIYKSQILDQITNAEVAYSTIMASNIDPNSLFRNIHYFIIHTSNVVKLIQPKNSDSLYFKNFRAKQLKHRYPHLPEFEPKLIKIRDDFEHYDERIDNWIISSKRHNYVDKSIGELKAIRGIDPKDNFRWYDPRNKNLYFCGEKYPLENLYSYLQKVKLALSR